MEEEWHRAYTGNAMMKSVEVDYPYDAYADVVLSYFTEPLAVCECVSLFVKTPNSGRLRTSFKLCMACEAFERQCDNTGCCETAVFHHGDMISQSLYRS